jgi:hypothetical protein
MSGRYAFRVRGNRTDAVLTAEQEGLAAETVPVTTAISGQFRDQAALFGSLARLRLLGLEVMDVRRLHRGGDGHPPRQPASEDVAPASSA